MSSSTIRVLIFFALTSVSESQTLEFVKQIGSGWNPDTAGWMSFVAFSADGSRVLGDGSAAPKFAEGTLTVWSFPEGRPIKHFELQPEAVAANWKYFASPSGIHDFETGALILPAREQLTIYAFTRDGANVIESAPGYLRGSRIRVLELPSGKQLRTFGNHVPHSMAISPDGKVLATSHWNVVVLWDIMTGERIASFRGFNRYVFGVAFSPDGTFLAAGSDSGTLQIWDVRGRTKLHSVELEGGDVSDPAFSPDGKLLAVGTYGTGTVWLIDVASGKILDHKKVSGLGCGSVAFSPNGEFLITPSTGGLIKWPYDRGGAIRVFRVKR